VPVGPNVGRSRRSSPVPKVFIEFGNLRNPTEATEATKLRSTSYQEALATTLAGGIVTYIGPRKERPTALRHVVVHRWAEAPVRTAGVDLVGWRPCGVDLLQIALTVTLVRLWLRP